MKQLLCCTLNEYVLCTLCKEKWCIDCWNRSDGTHHNGSIFIPCPLARVIVQWGRPPDSESHILVARDE